MMHKLAFALLIICTFVLYTQAFVSMAPKAGYKLRQLNTRFALEPSTVQQLEEMKGRYDRLMNNASPEAESEVAKLAPIVEKYSAYLKLKKLLVKLRVMYKNEQSPNRQEKQLNAFIDLFKGKAETEEYLKEKLGLPFSSKQVVPQSLVDFMKADEEYQMIKKKFEEVEVKLPEGKSTLEALLLD